MTSEYCEQVPCFGCEHCASRGDPDVVDFPGVRCWGSEEIRWNPSRINDPQCELDAPCPGCPDCKVGV
jgi:hypothetical protein